MTRDRNNRFMPRTRRGVVLLVTLVLLIVLSTLGYTLTSRVATQRHRNQYIIDYTAARYACDSAVRYALATLEEIDPQLVSRPNEPDFSDLFALSDVEYHELLAEWNIGPEFAESGSEKESSGEEEAENVNDVNDVEEPGQLGFADLKSMPIRGPYGAPWPYITEPVKFDIGSATVRIEIEDENAKYPLGWALLDDPKIQREVDAGFVTFCELAGLDPEKIDALTEQLDAIGKIKPFKVDFKPITKTVKTPAMTPAVAGAGSRTTRTPARTYRKPISAAQQYSEQTEHFAKIFHSSLIDTEALARPTIVTESRKESPLRYIGMWGSRKVNINTAPRHVLEAAFIFGGNEVEIAETIIQLRRQKVFGTIDELKDEVLRFSDSIDKSAEFITTTSRFFTIRITAVSGSAKASSIIAITKDGDTVKQVAAINS